MTRIDASSTSSSEALGLVDDLQRRFAAGLEAVSARRGHASALRPISWLRDDGRHGGGTRLVAVDTPVFNRAAINISSVHYDDEPTRRLRSATALSTIIHPHAPRAPSVHVHISWTELRDRAGTWRIMADLNPAIEAPAVTDRFREIMRDVAPSRYDAAAAQGDKYFWIPALERHRGATHYYLEGYATRDPDADFEFARRFGEAVLDGYIDLLDAALVHATPATADDHRLQLEYHTLYFFQVLTLDRGTTSGLLVHDQNDVGILGSLPARIDRELLKLWAARVAPPQDDLVRGLVAALPDAHPCPVDDDVRAELARVIRAHYRAHPEALELQAAGDIVPPTVANHLMPR